MTAIDLIALGPPPWIDFSGIHFWLDVDDRQLNMELPSARLAAGTRTIAALPAADIHLWTDVSVAANGDSGAGFAIFVQ